MLVLTETTVRERVRAIVARWEHKAQARRVSPTALHAIADRLSPRVRREFLQAVQRLRGQVNLQDLADAFEAGSKVRLDRVLSIDTLPVHLKPAVSTLRTVFAQAGAESARQLSALLNENVSFSLTNPRAVSWAEEYAARLVTRVTEATKQGIRDVIVDAFEQGIPPKVAARQIREQIGLTSQQTQAVRHYRQRLREEGLSASDVAQRAEKYSQKLLRHRSEIIARQETMTAANRGQHLLWQDAVDKGLLDRERTQRIWSTATDDRLCFVAGTLIATPKGAQAIETLRCGDVVLTHDGPQPIRATASRMRSGTLVRVQTVDGSATATPDHPYLVVKPDGPKWVAAAFLQQGDLLCQMQGAGDGMISTDGFYLGISDPDDRPAVFTEPSRLSGVTRLVAVPVDAISFQYQPATSNQEIDAVAAKSSFLDKSNPAICERETHGLFQDGFGIGAAVTSERAELAICVCGHAAEALSAGLANDIDGGAATVLRAVLPNAFLRREATSTTGAVGIGQVRPATGQRTHGVSIGNRLRHTEGLRTNGTGLFNCDHGAVGSIAGARAIRPIVALLGEPERLPTVPAFPRGVGSSRDVIAGVRTEAFLTNSEWLTTPDAITHNQSSVTPHVVYSLEIENARTFFAAGVLVHNCPICEPMDGQVVGLEEVFTGGDGSTALMPPIHIACRCSVGLKL